MAAATIASRKFNAAGDMLFYTYNLTSVADTNTLTTDVGELINVIVSAKTAGTPQYAGWTSALTSGRQVITFDMSGTIDLQVTVIGR